MNDKIIGIIGGMGPEATAAFYIKIIKATKAKKDQDHFRVIIDSNPKIPDRTKAILGEGENPVEAIVQAGKNLEKLHADIACMPCITSHYFIKEIQQQLSIPVLNALEELNKFVIRQYKSVNTIGVLATSGTIETNLFNQSLPNFNVIYPTVDSQQTLVMEAIYGEKGIKRGNTGNIPLKLLITACEELIEKGAQVIISGCTEISIVLKPHHIGKPIIDPMDVMAEVVVRH
ncbi:MAG: aspartate/glutamate racemase family protein [Eubacteriales bacterium]